MGVILRRLVEEVLTIGQVMLTRRCRGRERRLNTLRMTEFKGAIHLIRRDMVESTVNRQRTTVNSLFHLVGSGLALPIEFGSLKERQCTHHIGAGKGEGVLDATVYMALCSQVDDTIDLLLLHEFIKSLEVADIHLDKLIVGLVLDILQVGQVARVGQLIDVDDVILGIFVHEKAYHMAPNEASATRDDDISLCHKPIISSSY